LEDLEEMMSFSRRSLAISMSVLTLSLAVAAGAVTQEGEPQPPAPKQEGEAPKEAPPVDPAMAEFIAKNTPTDAHKALARLAGDYEVACKFYVAKDQPPVEEKGQARLRMVLDGRFLQERFDGQYMGQPFQGIGVTGFDTMTGRHFSTWMDSWTTFVVKFDGEVDAAGAVYTYKAEVPGPQGVKKTRTVTTIRSADVHVFEYFETGADGVETKTMELTYTRTAAPLPRKRRGAAADDDGGDGN
jgi:hypothetical protein